MLSRAKNYIFFGQRWLSATPSRKFTPAPMLITRSLCVPQLQYQCERLCGYALMQNNVELARCLAGRRFHDAENLLFSTCSVVTTAALRRGDRLRIQAVDGGVTIDTTRYVLVPVTATPAEVAATNFWGVVKLADLD